MNNLKIFAVIFIAGFTSCSVSKFFTRQYFKEVDKNKDGVVAYEESWLHYSNLETGKQNIDSLRNEHQKDFYQMDSNRDNMISKNEMKVYILKKE